MSKALEINPAEVNAWHERGILRAAIGELDEALADFGRVIEMDPRYAKAYANRGMIMLLRRHDTEAQRDFAKALELDSSLKVVLEKSVDQIVKTRRPPP